MLCANDNPPGTTFPLIVHHPISSHVALKNPLRSLLSKVVAGGTSHSARSEHVLHQVQLIP